VDSGLMDIAKSGETRGVARFGGARVGGKKLLTVRGGGKKEGGDDTLRGLSLVKSKKEGRQKDNAPRSEKEAKRGQVPKLEKKER